METAFNNAPLHLSGGVDGPDAITAAIAIRLNQPVATFNVKHISAIPGLSVVQPYSR